MDMAPAYEIKGVGGLKETQVKHSQVQHESFPLFNIVQITQTVDKNSDFPISISILAFHLSIIH